MSGFLEILGRGLDVDLTDLLDRYFWSPQAGDVQPLPAEPEGDGEQGELHVRLGVGYLRASQLDEAVAHLSRACGQKPDDAGARLALASAYDQQGRLAEALEHLAAADRLRPGEVPILFAMGFCRERLREPQSAAEHYRQAVAAGPSFAPARQRLAAVALVLDRLDEAVEQYQDLRQEYAEDTWYRAALAHLYFRAGEFFAAGEEFQSAIAMEPENWALLDDEAEALAAESRIPEAIDRLHLLIEQQGSFADLHARLADLYGQAGKDAEAMEHYRQALDLQPNYLEATVRLGTHHLIFGRWAEAAETFHRAAELNDCLLANYVGVGAAQAAAGDKSRARDTFELAAAIEPNSILLLTEMAKLQLKTVMVEKLLGALEAEDAPPTAGANLEPADLLARQIARHAEQIHEHPRRADLRYRYGVLLRSQQRDRDAARQFTKAVEINPCYAAAQIKLGITQQRLGLADEAMNTLTGALQIDSGLLGLHYRLGLMYTDRRQLEQAIEEMAADAGGPGDTEQVRAGVALALQAMGLLDGGAATWRSLCKMHDVAAS